MPQKQPNSNKNPEQKLADTKGQRVVRVPQNKKTQPSKRIAQIWKAEEAAEKLLKESELETPAKRIAQIWDTKEAAEKLLDESNNSSFDQQKESELEIPAELMAQIWKAEEAAEKPLVESNNPSFDQQKESDLQTTEPGLLTKKESIQQSQDIKDISALLETPDLKAKAIGSSEPVAKPVYLNKNSDDLQRIQRIMKSKQITIDMNTRSALNAQQINTIKGIFD